MVRSTNNSLATMSSSTVDSPMVPSTVPLNTTTAAGNSSTAPETSASTSHLSVDSGVLVKLSLERWENLCQTSSLRSKHRLAPIPAHVNQRYKVSLHPYLSRPLHLASIPALISLFPKASAGNLNVPSFISTYCTLADPQVSVSTQSYGPLNTSMRARGASTSQCSSSPQSALPTENVSPFSGKAFVIGPRLCASAI